MGRWKGSDNGAYYDANDSGPDQVAAPPGQAQGPDDRYNPRNAPRTGGPAGPGYPDPSRGGEPGGITGDGPTPWPSPGPYKGPDSPYFPLPSPRNPPDTGGPYFPLPPYKMPDNPYGGDWDPLPGRPFPRFPDQDTTPFPGRIPSLPPGGPIIPPNPDENGGWGTPTPTDVPPGEAKRPTWDEHPGYHWVGTGGVLGGYWAPDDGSSPLGQVDAPTSFSDAFKGPSGASNAATGANAQQSGNGLWEQIAKRMIGGASAGKPKHGGMLGALGGLFGGGR